MPDAPLNPDALRKKIEVFCESMAETGQMDRMEAIDLLHEAQNHLAVAQPELQANSKPNQNFEVVNSVEDLAKAWHAGFCKGEQTAFSERPVNPDTINPYKNGETP